MADGVTTPEIEIWRDIPEFAGVYQASSEGNIRALERRGKDGRKLPARDLRPHVNALGYRHICLPWNGRYRSISVHYAVMTAFVGPRPDGMYICHNNGNPSDNRLCNLRYDTPSGNEADKVLHGTRPNRFGEDAGCNKITERQAREIIALNGKISQYAIGQKYGISRSQVAKILYGIRWPHLGGAGNIIPVRERGDRHWSARAKKQRQQLGGA